MRVLISRSRLMGQALVLAFPLFVGFGTAVADPPVSGAEDNRGPLLHFHSSQRQNTPPGYLHLHGECLLPDRLLKTSGPLPEMAVLDFASETERHAWLGIAVAHLLKHAFSCTDGVRLAPAARVIEAYRALSIGTVDLDETGDARKMGERMDVRFVLFGEVFMEGEKGEIRARLLGLGDSGMEADITVRGPIRNLVDLQAKLFRRACAALGVAVPPDERLHLSRFRTNNLNALRSYILGVYASEGTYRKVSHFRKALEADPSFVAARFGLASAYMGVGLSYSYRHYWEKAAREFEEVLQRAPDHRLARHRLGLCRAFLADKAAAGDGSVRLSGGRDGGKMRGNGG